MGEGVRMVLVLRGGDGAGVDDGGAGRRRKKR